MKNKPQHTQGEWKIRKMEHHSCHIECDGKKIVIAEFGEVNINEAEANAKRIVLCCNMHDELIDAIKTSLSMIGYGNEAFDIHVRKLLKQSEQ